MPDSAPDLRDVLDAQRVIAPYLDETPLRRYPALDGMVGASLFGVAATIFVPRGANPVKVSSMRSLGATVIEHGEDFDEARERCEQVAATHDARYIHSGIEPLLIAGVATATLEPLAREPSIDAIVVPVGGGSGAAGACVVAKAIDPRIVVIGVQSEAAPAAYRAWREHRPVADETHTFAEGLQTRVSFELPQRILAERLDDFVLLSDDELRAGSPAAGAAGPG